MKINIRALSDIGIERTNNEDAVAVCRDLTNPANCILHTDGYVKMSRFGSLAVVADGMGGANAGEIASKLAIESIVESFREANLPQVLTSESAVCAFLRECIAKSNQTIMNYVIESPDSFGLGTTIVLLWLVKDKAYVTWCGDSRCYCFNPDSGLKLLTKDHSLVQEMVDRGEITQEQSFKHPDNNIITRCLGDVDADPDPEFLIQSIADGDVFLLCSDGLCGYCRDREIEKLMYRHFDDIDQCQSALLNLALKAGGQDNISISLCATLPDCLSTPKVGFKTKIKRLFS